MEEAAKYFKKAYEKLPAQQIRRQYFYTCRMFMDEGKWREECESMGADEKERKEIVYEMSQVKPEQMAWNTEQIDEMLSDFKKEYHRSTGFQLVFSCYVSYNPKSKNTCKNEKRRLQK